LQAANSIILAGNAPHAHSRRTEIEKGTQEAAVILKHFCLKSPVDIGVSYSDMH
jgi:hypothetical protein